MLKSRARNSLICFLSELLVWQKNERMSDALKKMSDSLIFGEQPERFAHDCSFPLSDLSESLIATHF